jgi:hypothetical protein
MGLCRTIFQAIIVLIVAVAVADNFGLAEGPSQKIL